MQIYQMVHTLNYGDAISSEALAIKRVLGEEGIKSTIYSLHAHQLVAHETRSWTFLESDIEETKRQGNSALLLLHYSLASPLNELFSRLPGLRRAIIYHNLTPVSWFSSYNARVRADLHRGREELAELCHTADTVLADSTFNRDELHHLGVDKVAVLPLFLDTKKWISTPSRPTLKGVIRRAASVNILHVGRLAPNKCLEDVIKAFYFYHHKINQQSRLWLIGIDIDTEIYAFELHSLVRQLRLQDAVCFTGAVADSELRTFYENSQLYLCLSEHEGFCVPLLEAMYFSLPVIAYASCAVQETLGDGGLLLKNKDPEKIAELIDLVLSNEAIKKQMKTNAQTQLAHFSEERFRTLLKTLLLKPANEKQAAFG